MAQEQITTPGGGPEENNQDSGFGQLNISTEGTDELLDEIDDLLEDNAEEFVRAYVQKGGQ